MKNENYERAPNSNLKKTAKSRGRRRLFQRYSESDSEDSYNISVPSTVKIASPATVGVAPHAPTSALGGVSNQQQSQQSPRKHKTSATEIFFKYSSPLLMKRTNRPKNLSGGSGAGGGNAAAAGGGHQSSGEGETAAELGQRSMQGYVGGDQVNYLFNTFNYLIF